MTSPDRVVEQGSVKTQVIAELHVHLQDKTAGAAALVPDRRARLEAAEAVISRIAYFRDDGARMVEIAPHQAVNAGAAMPFAFCHKNGGPVAIGGVS